MNVDTLASRVADLLASRTPTRRCRFLIHPLPAKWTPPDASPRLAGALWRPSPSRLRRRLCGHGSLFVHPPVPHRACQGCRDHTRDGQLGNDGTGGFADFVRDGCRIRVASTAWVHAPRATPSPARPLL